MSSTCKIISPPRYQSRLWHYVLASGLAWTALIAVSLGWSNFEQQRETLANARDYAQIGFLEEMLRRFLLDGHVDSAQVTNKMLPSSDLARVKKHAPDSLGPMLHQMLEQSSKSVGYRSHLASLKPTWPENVADVWETGAIRAFAKEKTEVASVAAMDGQEYMRVMRPLVVEASCLTCHEAQDYKVGEIRGGISVSVPLAPLRANAHSQSVALFIINGIIWVLGLGVIGFAVRGIQAHNLERDRAGLMLRDSEVRYRTLADSGQALVWTSGPDKKRDYFNRPWLTFTGHTLEQELGDGWTAGVHPDDRARCLEIFATAFDRWEAVSMVHRLRRHDGEFRWIQNDAFPRHDSQGNFVGYIGHGLDITERKRAETALKESEERYRLLINTSPDAIVLQQAGRIVFANPATFTLLGAGKPEDLIDTPAIEHVHPDFRPLVAARMQQTTAAGQMLPLIEEKFLRLDGTSIDVEVTGGPLILGGIPTVQLVVRDITERKRREETLRQTLGEIEELSYSVAHDMRAPLRAMRGFTDLLIGEHAKNLDADGLIYLQRIGAAAERMDTLIDDVLTYTRVLRSDVRPRSVDIEVALREIIGTYPELLMTGAEITVVSPMPKVLGNAANLTLCFSNLLANAVKFIDLGTKAKVKITAEERGANVRIWFEDNGIGIGPKDQERIFNLFERVSSSASYPGTGIGLAVVRKAVERLKGQVGVESAIGRGSRFWIELPKAS